MDTVNLFILIGAVAVIWYVVTTIMIYDYLKKNNIKVSFLFLRFLAPKYAHQYKELSQKESGKTGPLFYHWIISINCALIVTILLVILNLL